MGSAPRQKAAPPPATAIVTEEPVAPQDIVLGGEDQLDGTQPKRGKKALSRPAPTTGLNI